MPAAEEQEIVEVQPLRSSSLSIGSGLSPLQPAAVPRSRSSTTVLLRSLSRNLQSGAKHGRDGAEKGMQEKEQDPKDCEAGRIERAVSTVAIDSRSVNGVANHEKQADDTHTRKLKTRGICRRDVGMWCSSLVEMIATLVLTFVSIAAVIACLRADFNFPRIAVALTQFLIYTMCIVAVAPLSGAYLNPSFSFTAMLTGHISAFRGVLYILAQSIGSILGALFVRTAVPSDTAQMYYLGGCLLKQQVLVDADLNVVASVGADSGPALVAELFFSFLLIAVAMPILIFPSCSPPRHTSAPGHPMLSHFLSFSDPALLRAAFIVGLLLGLLIFVSGQLLSPGYTSAGMNPARCFGPAVALGGAALWKPQWVFWLGPFLAAALFAFLYRVVFYTQPWRRPHGADQWQDYNTQTKLPLVGTSENPSSIATQSKTVSQIDDPHQGLAVYATPAPKEPASRRMDVFLHIKATMQKPEQLEVSMDERTRYVSMSSSHGNQALADPPPILLQDPDHGFLERANLSLRNLMELPSTSSNTTTTVLKLEELLKDSDELL